MARKKITLNTEPHVVEIGDTELEFLPEVMGDEFVEAFGELKEAQKAASGLDLDDLSTLDPSLIRGAARGMRSFLARLMLPETAELFTRINVVDKAGKVLDSFHDQDEAKAYAEKRKGARTVDAFPLPDRHMITIMEFVVELYGAGADERPPTSSSASATPSRKGGRRGMGVSPSRVSTPASGR
ncbi:hypothetical protein [Streptomyces sp. NPDC088847]|uniref:hypothetical protein n=1 Tax=Streptomyces sp. NPDC088847 TaxID=3365909 RepID=UPI00381E29DE